MSNQSILKELSPEYSLKGLMLQLKLQSCGHLMGRSDSLEKSPMLEKIEGRSGRGWQRKRWMDTIPDSMDMSLRKLRNGEGQGSPLCCGPWDQRETAVTEQLKHKCLLEYPFPHTPSLFLSLSLCLCFCLSSDLTNYSLEKWVVSPFSHRPDFSHYLPEVLFCTYSTLLSENKSKCSISFRFELLEKQKSYHIW